MSVGYDREQRIVNKGDTAPLYAFLYDPEDNAVQEDSVLTVDFTILRPDGTSETLEGELEEDGTGRLHYDNCDLEGEYVAVATFVLASGAKKSTRTDFQVTDPFRTFLTDNELICSGVWTKLEDIFDSQDGGPWLRDMTLNVFSPIKIEKFIPEALLDINLYNPPTNFLVTEFTSLVTNPADPNNPSPNPTLPLIVEGTFLAVVRHLMRSYVEQPAPMGGQVTYEDRRDYLQRWGTIYQIESQWFDHLVKLWKRQFLGLGDSSLLVSSKAGRLLPAPLRARNIGRGYY